MAHGIARYGGEPRTWATAMLGLCLPGAFAETAEEGDESAEAQHKIDSEALMIFVMLLIATTGLIWMFKTRRFRGLHETGVAMLMGVAAGVLIDRASKHDVNTQQICHNTTVRKLNGDSPGGYKSIEDEAIFDPEMFFFVLLPPIIFFAGYDLKQKHFFRNISSILLFAFIGTTMACFITGGMLYWFTSSVSDVGLTLVECLLFGAIISATDPVTVLAIYHDLHVDHNLYALVFGESVLNDAVALVLYSTIEKFQDHQQVTGVSFLHAIWVFTLIFLGSLACGTFIGMTTAIMMKFTSVQRLPMIEQALFALLSYMTFLIGEAAGLSGIVSVLFCGITQAHYTYSNMSEESQQASKNFFGLINFLAENFIFSYIGLSFFTYKCHNWNVPFILFSLFTIIVSRAAHVYPLSLLINVCRKRGKKGIPMSYQHCLCFAGLRGAIAFALAMRNTDTAGRQLILSTTLVIVLVTVIFFGGGTMRVLQLFKIRVGVTDTEETADHYDDTRGSQVGYAVAPTDLNASQKSCLARNWQGFDKKYLKPVLTGNEPGTDSLAAVLHTIHCWRKGLPETHIVSLPRAESPKDAEYSDDSGDSDASSELLDFDSDDDDMDLDVDAVDGDIGRTSTLPVSADKSNVFAGFEPMSPQNSSA